MTIRNLYRHLRAEGKGGCDREELGRRARHGDHERCREYRPGRRRQDIRL